MTGKVSWDGKAKGSVLGNLIFIKLISLAGVIPAYILCFFVTWKYVFTDHDAVRALKEFRTRIGLGSPSRWHLFRHFYSFGTAMIDRIAFMTRKRTPFTFTYNGDCYYHEAHGGGKGVITVSAHVGNWEIAGNQFAVHFNEHMHVVILENEQEAIKRIFKNVVDNRQFSTIAFSSEGLAMMVPIREALRKNEIVGFHGDRIINDAYLSLPFLGKQAKFPAGPFYIAAITGAPVLPVFLIKTGLFHFTSRTFPPIYLNDIPRENRDSYIQTAMEKYVSILETMVRNYPYQWYNFYQFWK